jgi:hypothetical protein
MELKLDPNLVHCQPTALEAFFLVLCKTPCMHLDSTNSALQDRSSRFEVTEAKLNNEKKDDSTDPPLANTT